MNSKYVANSNTHAIHMILYKIFKLYLKKNRGIALKIKVKAVFIFRCTDNSHTD